MAKKKTTQKKSSRSKQRKLFSVELTSDTKRSIAAVVTFVFAFLFTLGFLHQAGVFGEWLNTIASRIFGWGKWLFPVILIFATIVLLRQLKQFYLVGILGLITIYLGSLGLFHIFYPTETFLAVAQEGRGGGMLGYAIANFLTIFTGKVAAIIILFALLLLGIIVSFNISLVHFAEKFFVRLKELREERKKRQKEVQKQEQEKNGEGEEASLEVADQKTSVEPEGLSQEEELFGEPSSDKKEPPSQTLENISNIRFENEDAPLNRISADLQEETPEENILEEKNVSEESDSYTHQEKSAEQITWRLPPVTLLERANTKALSGDTAANQKLIQETLRQFNISVVPEGVKVGPTVTQYRFRPAAGVRLEKITALSSNLAMVLAAHPIRIEAPIPGMSLVGIEVPNKSVAIVKLREVLESNVFKEEKDSLLTLALGKDVGGAYILGNLEKMPHLLVAGATNTGKSVCINTLLLSLLYQNTPDDLELILVDPKRVELSLYNGIPHLKTPVITENKKVVNALRWAVGEMERRYKVLEEVKSRNVESYNSKVFKKQIGDEYKKMPFLVIVIDELADLMMTNGKEVEGAIVRLAQMARAVGIHLIVSTQKPIAEVITGLIKSNITTRISFKVTTQVDSRTILDGGGAEKLVGKGDMLYITANSSELKRIQGVYVSEEEVSKVVNFFHKQKVHNFDEGEELDDSAQGHDSVVSFQAGADGERDESFEEAKEIVIQENKASTSLLQRRMRVGYNRAARLMDELEEAGVIGPANGAKPREILKTIEEGTEIRQAQNQEASPEEEMIQEQKERDKWQL